MKADVYAIDDNFASPTVACDLYDYLNLSAEKIATGTYAIEEPEAIVEVKGADNYQKSVDAFASIASNLQETN